MIHGELILGILERASGPLTMGEIESAPEAMAAKLCREDTQFVLRQLHEQHRVTAAPGCPGWRYQIKGKCFGPELPMAEQQPEGITTETQSAQGKEMPTANCQPTAATAATTTTER